MMTDVTFLYAAIYGRNVVEKIAFARMVTSNRSTCYLEVTFCLFFLDDQIALTHNI